MCRIRPQNDPRGLKSSLSLDFALNWKHLRTPELISTHATCLSTNQEFQHPEPGTDFYKILGMDRLWAISRPGSRNRLQAQHQMESMANKTFFQSASWRKSVLLDLAAKKQHTKLCNEPFYQSTTNVSPSIGETATMFFIRLVNSTSLDDLKGIWDDFNNLNGYDIT